MKKKLLNLITLTMIITMILSLLVGCKGQGDRPVDSESGSQNDKNEDTLDRDVKDSVTDKEVIDPFGKYDDPITITTCLRTFEATKKIPVENSLWSQKFKEYGINVEVEWAADMSQYDNRVNTAIASGDIPDLMYCGAGQPLATLHKADMILDVKEYFDYLSPTNKEWLTQGIGEDALRSVTYDGKVKMIPANVTELINNSFPLFVRKDWLDNLGLPIPKTLDDFKKTAIAFAKEDPDKNNKDDTYGFTLMGQTNLITDWGGLYGFFGGYGIQPCTWYDGMLFYSKDSNGNALWDGKRPEVKEGLQLLADLYKEGAIPQDFPTMDGNKVTEDLNGSKAGMVCGVRGLPMWAINKTIQNNSEAEWYAMNMPTKDGSEAPIFGFQPVNVGYVISKDCKNPEAIIKMLNIVTDLSYLESPNYDTNYSIDTPEISGYSYIGINNPIQERIDNEKLFEALKAEDSSNLDNLLKERYDKVMEYTETQDPSLWPMWNSYYPEEGHAYYLTYGLNNSSLVKKNVWWSLPTEEMVNKLPIFKKLAEETITKIITGNAEVEEWDKMVEQWDSLGGEEITKIVQENMDK